MISLDGVNHWGIADDQERYEDLICVNQTGPKEWVTAKYAKWVGIVFNAYLKDEVGALMKLNKLAPEAGVDVTFVTFEWLLFDCKSLGRQVQYCLLDLVESSNWPKILLSKVHIPLQYIFVEEVVSSTIWILKSPVHLQIVNAAVYLKTN